MPKKLICKHTFFYTKEKWFMWSKENKAKTFISREKVAVSLLVTVSTKYEKKKKLGYYLFIGLLIDLFISSGLKNKRKKTIKI